MRDFQDRGEPARTALGIDGTAGDAQDIAHRYQDDALTGSCLVCGLALAASVHWRGASEPTRAAPSEPQPPEQPNVGSQDDPTSTGLPDAFVAAGVAIRAALATVMPYVVRQERRRAGDIVRASQHELLCSDCGVRVHDEDVRALARKIEGDAGHG